MQRRRFLAAAGAAVAGLAGCLGGSAGEDPATTRRTTATPESAATTTRAARTETAEPIEPTTTAAREPAGPRHGDDLPADPEPADGYPPAFETTTAAPSADPASFETIDVEGESVTLAPIEVTYRWYARGEARFADARGTTQYERSHVLGAASSPVGGGGDDPVAEWPTGDRVVCYCGCPHHLSSMRAAELQAAGFDSVFVVDEGFWEWHDRRYPMAGDDVGESPAAVSVDGVADNTHAGAYARASHPPSGQREAARIGPDGRYRLELRFAGVDRSTPIVVSTPGYEVTAPLGDLATSRVRADHAASPVQDGLAANGDRGGRVAER